MIINCVFLGGALCVPVENGRVLRTSNQFCNQIAIKRQMETATVTKDFETVDTELLNRRVSQ